MSEEAERRAAEEAERQMYEEMRKVVQAEEERQRLLDYLEAGQPLSEFLEDFPTVTREQAVAALEQAKEALLARARPA